MSDHGGQDSTFFFFEVKPSKSNSTYKGYRRWEVFTRLSDEDCLEERIYSISSCSRHCMDVTDPLCIANSCLVLPVFSGFLFRSICNKQGKVFIILDTMGFVPKPQHRCPVPVADEPNRIVIPKERTPNNIVKNLTYIMEEVFVNNGSQSFPLFGGNQSWSQREESFKLNSTMKVHCGFMRNGGAEMSSLDVNYVKKCRFVVASGIFDGYDVPPRPTNISHRSKKLFCFLMMVDEESLTFIKKNVTVREDSAGGQWVGIWRLVLLKNPPYDEPRRNGKVPKILTHRLFPQAQYSIWIDGKMELIVDPLLILERYLWRNKNTFAIAQHKHHRSIYEEADANKRRKRYARPLINLHMKIYRYEGMETWSIKKNTVSGKKNLTLLAQLCLLAPFFYFSVKLYNTSLQKHTRQPYDGHLELP
ncbi:probable hexosyltransferase MUCI70 isoform X5 [Mangifera indica]|uniref:probable hexosyltransferase MUCI70 isoform X5 n=1 Tax=Mangifera indica TaxID=29780 RepID=UPI001CFBAD1A|nr:probable hexosyltransferase MUCI70 isoform X5 [Mangifera indica]